MRFWQSWWRNLERAYQQEPPRLGEGIMLLLALILLLVWAKTGLVAYIILSLSYGIGASVSMLVRDLYTAVPRMVFTLRIGVISLALLVYSLCWVFFVVS